MHTSPLSKLDLTAFHWLFITKCHTTINIFLVDHFYSMVNHLLLLEKWDRCEIFKHRTWKRLRKVWKKLKQCLEFCSYVSWVCLLDPPPSLSHMNGHQGNYTVGAHLVTKNAPAAGWHHTQTHGPVKVWEPGFGGNNDGALTTSSWFPMHLPCRHVHRVLSLSTVMVLSFIVISRRSFSRVMSTVSL